MKEDKEKLDEIIRFFEIEKEKNAHYFNLLKEENKFNINTIFSIFAILIATSTTMFGREVFGALLIIALMFLIFITYYITSRGFEKINKQYINNATEYDVILSYLQSQKILESKPDLSPLIEKIRHLHRDDRWSTIKNFEPVWLEETIYIIQAIDNDLRSKESNASLGTKPSALAFSGAKKRENPKDFQKREVK